ncbi:MAG: ABC transporter substrate-binding protein [Candidatus Tectomicrobia bacterium]|nr:ABC transporter substrate-binding protein [Candidatus Tectomicrobia bacterium]
MQQSAKILQRRRSSAIAVRSGWRGGAWLLVFLLGASLVPVPSAAQSKVFKVGTSPIAPALALFVANDKGFFKELGYTAAIKKMVGGAVTVPAVESGDINFGFVNITAIILAHERGFDIQYVAPGWVFNSEKPGALLLVRKDSPIQSVKDLEGKKIAVNTIGPSVITMGLRALARKRGADYAKFISLELPFPQMETSLKNGFVEAVVAPEPFVALPIGHGVARRLDDPYGAIAPRFLVATFVAKKSWMATHREEAQTFHRGLMKAIEYLNAHPDEMPQVLETNTGLKAELARRMVMPEIPPELRLAHLQVVIDLAAEFGYIKAPFPARGIIADFVPVK